MIYTYAYRNRSLSKFLPEYMSILAEATTQGYTLPSAGQQLKQNLFIQTLKDSGVWNKSDLILVFANDGSKEFACINWKNPSGNKATLASSPTFTTNQGFTGSGSNWINSGYNPQGNLNYKITDASRYAYLRTVFNNNIIDGIDVSISNSMTTFPSTFQRINQGGGTNFSVSVNYQGVGMKSIHRTSSTAVTCFNDITGVTGTANGNTLSGAEQTILKSDVGLAKHQVSFYLMGASLISENSSLVTAFSTYLNSL